MNAKEKYIAYIIKHTEDYPNTDEITLESAETLLDNALPGTLPEKLSAEEVVLIWNTLVHNETVMDPDYSIA